MSFSTPVQVPPLNPTVEFDPDQRYLLRLDSRLELILEEYFDTVTKAIYIRISPEYMDRNPLFETFLDRVHKISNREKRTEQSLLDDRMNPRYRRKEIHESHVAILVANKSNIEKKLTAFKQLEPLPYFITRTGLQQIKGIGSPFDPLGTIVECTPFHVSELQQHLHTHPVD